VFGALLIFPFPINALPKLDWLAELVMKPLAWLTPWFAQAVLGLPEPATALNGSGDRTSDYAQLLLFAILGAIGAIAWSALDRRRSYPRRAARGRYASASSASAAFCFCSFFLIIWRLSGPTKSTSSLPVR
jgi:hypothetical protein